MATLTLTLPDAGGGLQPYTLRGSTPVQPAPGMRFNRIAYSAAHVVADPLAAVDPWLACAVDWDATIAYRRHLWSLGLGVAEAMDTAQRGMGLDWPTSLELIRRSLDAARDMPGALIASGCGTDHLVLENVKTVDDVIRGYEEQMEAIEKLGGKLIVMASRALARVAKARPTTNVSTTASCARQNSRWCCTGWATCSTRRWPATGAARHVDLAMDTALGIMKRMPARSTASRSRCSTRTRKSPCAAGCPPACACTPVTISTTPS
jgi:hypothetical protein